MDDKSMEENSGNVLTLPTIKTEMETELQPDVPSPDDNIITGISESVQIHEVEQQNVIITNNEDNSTAVLIQDVTNGEETIIHLENGDENQELLKKITSQDVECQTMLQELISNLGEPNSTSATTDKPQINTTHDVAPSITLPTIQANVLTTAVSTSETSQTIPAISLLTTGRNMLSMTDSTSTHLDLTKTINITSQTEAIINGTRYLLSVKPDSNQICAYPVDDTEAGAKKKRGRPRRVTNSEAGCSSSICERVGSDDDMGESQTDAAEGLLELCNAGPDGARRSVRRRKRSKALEDYETKGVQVPNVITSHGNTMSVPKLESTTNKLGPVKKVRGRPRRYPSRGQSSTTKIPAVIIPGPNGQTLMMAPIKGLQNLQAFQQQMYRVPRLEPALAVSNGQLNSRPDHTGDNNKINGAIDNEDNKAVNSITAGGDQSLTFMANNKVCEQITTSITNTPDGNATVIKLPQDMISLYTKQEPLTLGLKANEVELESLRCIKCNFQAYFREQYQNHISEHADEVIKCKCCKYLSFDQEDIITHTRNFHPRCICTLCDFTGDHAYVVKRHMTRHNSIRFSCEICGKVYKDQYILRMHVKMVHLPADVLFECVTCDKKFTRKAHLKRHLRIHEPNKPYKCQKCEYRGSEKSDIVKHSKVHEDPQYACEICGKQFRHVKNRDLHIKRHRGQKDYKCGICDFFGYTFTDIRKHIERKHWSLEKQVKEEGNDYNCVHCNLAFSCSSQQELMDHQLDCLATIEQTLSITNSSGETSKAFLRLPREVDDGSGNKIITIEEVEMDDLEVDLQEHGVTLTEDQLIHPVHDTSQTLVLDSSSLVTEQHLVVPEETETTLIVAQ